MIRKYVLDFLRRGLIACGLGPILLAVVYLVMQQQGLADTLTVSEVCRGIFSLSALAFMAGGLNILYQIDRLPLPMAILIHGGVLYVSYLGTYLLNGWLGQGLTPLLVFTAVFAAGYLVIWGVIYALIKRNTSKVNEALNKMRQAENGQ